MTYKPSPRPTFSEPTSIPFATVTRHLWGDPEAGEVSDWIYVSSEKIHQLVFGLPPGGAFRHSDAYRTIFGADVVYYVLSGLMIFADPQSGEVHRVGPGEAAFYRRDTWHHVFNHSTEPLRVLELFAPPPSKGTSGSYASKQPYLADLKYGRDEWLGRFPGVDGIPENRVRVVREADYQWRLEGAQQQLLVGLLVSSEHLTVGTASLLPGKPSDAETHSGDESLYVTEGTLNIHLPDADGQRWFELHPGDGFYVPSGTPHRYFNMSGTAVRWLFGVAPGYLPTPKPLSSNGSRGGT